MVVNDAVAVLGAIIAVASLTDAGIQRYTKAKQAEYASQRDFEHIKRNQEQYKIALRDINEEMHDMRVMIVELSAQVKILVAQKDTLG